LSIERQSTEQRFAVLPGDPTIDYPLTLPYGYRPGKGVLEPDGEKADIVRQIFSDAVEGHSPEKIAARLAEVKPLPEGLETWTPELIEQLLRDKTYIGEWSGIGSVTPLVERDQFDDAQKILYAPALASHR
jgi:hypothetical protein